MTNHIETKIRNRAYEIWESQGRSGNPEDHWLEAEREFAGGGSTQASVATDAIGGPDPTAGLHAAETQPSAKRPQPAAEKAAPQAKSPKAKTASPKSEAKAPKADAKSAKASAGASTQNKAAPAAPRKKTSA